MTEELEQPLLGENETKKEIKVEKVSRNVYVTLVMVSIWGLADSIWTGAVLSAWLFLLAGGDPNPTPDPSNVYFAICITSFAVLRPRLPALKTGHKPNSVVGGVEAMQGLAGLFTALPIGYLADIYGKALMCKIGGVGFALSSALTLFAILGDWSTSTEIYLFCIALICWGIFGGIYSGPAQALFADSVPTGQRSYYYTILQNCYMAPSIIGPIIAIILFQRYGDHWTIEELRLPFVVGILLEIPTAFLPFLLSEKYAVEEEEEEEEVKDEKNDDKNTEEKDKIETKKQSYKIPCINYVVTRASIPYILFCSDLLYALGSGMTIKFVPLFFAKEVGLTPSIVQFIMIIVSFLIISFTWMAQKASKTFGRVQVVIFCRSTGICILIFLSILLAHGVRQWYIVIPIYLGRTAFMNSGYPLDESILMDNVKKSERARWKSLESISVAGWCGSAFIGGILADKFSYDFSFLMTALLQGTGCLTYSILIPLVLDEQDQVKVQESSESVEEET